MPNYQEYDAIALRDENGRWVGCLNVQVEVQAGDRLQLIECRNISYNKRPKRNVWAPDLLPNLRLRLHRARHNSWKGLGEHSR